MEHEELTKEKLLQLVIELERLCHIAATQIAYLENVTLKRMQELEQNFEDLETKHKYLCQVLNSLMPENRLN